MSEQAVLPLEEDEVFNELLREEHDVHDALNAISYCRPLTLEYARAWLQGLQFERQHGN